MNKLTHLILALLQQTLIITVYKMRKITQISKLFINPVNFYFIPISNLIINYFCLLKEGKGGCPKGYPNKQYFDIVEFIITRDHSIEINTEYLTVLDF